MISQTLPVSLKGEAVKICPELSHVTRTPDMLVAAVVEGRKEVCHAWVEVQLASAYRILKFPTHLSLAGGVRLHLCHMSCHAACRGV